MTANPDGAAANLCELAERGDVDQLRLSVTAENCQAGRLSDGLTPLMCAARAAGRPTERHRDCAECLLHAAGDPDAQVQLANAADLSGQSCLHHAAASDNVAVLEEALRVGAGVNAQDRQGRTALLVVVEQSKIEAARLLLRAGADQQFPLDEDDRSRVEVAAEENLAMQHLLKRYQPRSIETFEEVSKEKRTLIQDVIRGGFCDLYDTETKPPNLPVVVRVLRNQSNAGVREAEIRGLEAIKKAKHKNIAQHLRSDVTDRGIELFLEKVEGKTLRQILVGAGPFDEVRIQKYFEQISNALCYLHSHPNGPIVHRDIRCENIMIGRVGILKLIDFGFALPEGSVCIPNATLSGVLRNMAPEVLEENSQIGRSSDIWAAGCVLYAMAVGKDPYTSDSTLRLALEIYREVPQIQPADKFSPELLNLFEKCMQKEPTARISAAGMLLHPFLTGGGRCRNM